MLVRNVSKLLERVVPALNRSPGARLFSAKVNEDVLNVEVLSGENEGIVVFGLNRVKAKNALNKALTERLDDALDAVRFDQKARVLILRSHVPGVFCAGADLKERLTLTQTEVQVFVTRLRAMMSKIENLPIPVICALDGAALGGGLEMALATDIRVASTLAKVGLVETKLAILPGAGGTQRLPRLIGPSKAKELIFTSRIISGQEALQMGIVNHCVDHNKSSAYQKALDLAREIVPNGPVGVKMAKQAINRGIQVDINNGCAIEELCYAQVIPTKDRIEGLTAFQEKRKPIYRGE